METVIQADCDKKANRMHSDGHRYGTVLLIRCVDVDVEKISKSTVQRLQKRPRVLPRRGMSRPSKA